MVVIVNCHSLFMAMGKLVYNTVHYPYSYGDSPWIGCHLFPSLLLDEVPGLCQISHSIKISPLIKGFFSDFII
jgi:hypothetical protein